jgi:hypothetical protein
LVLSKRTDDFKLMFELGDEFMEEMTVFESEIGDG